MNNPDHRKNILASEFKMTGIGISKGKDGFVYITQIFMTPYNPVSNEKVSYFDRFGIGEPLFMQSLAVSQGIIWQHRATLVQHPAVQCNIL